MKNLKNLSNCLTMIKSQGFEAEHILLVQLFGCIEAYWSLSGKEVFEEPVFVPIQGFEEKVGYNDLSNMNQEDILKSDKQSENVVDMVIGSQWHILQIWPFSTSPNPTDS